jgi:hypothetical protein
VRWTEREGGRTRGKEKEGGGREKEGKRERE